jgi:hypothetical protein
MPFAETRGAMHETAAATTAGQGPTNAVAARGAEFALAAVLLVCGGLLYRPTIVSGT